MTTTPTNAQLATRLRQEAETLDPQPALTIAITPNDKGNPPGKLADAELHFMTGPLHGLKLIGFSVWERRTGGGRNVTFPARQYSVNGERRSFALLRPVTDTNAQERIRNLILDAFGRFEEDPEAYRTRTRYDQDGNALPNAPNGTNGPDAHTPNGTPVEMKTAPPKEARASVTTTEETLGRQLGDAIAQAAAPLSTDQALALAATLAAQLWPTLDRNQCAGIRMGLFPAEIMRETEQKIAHHDAGRLLAVALMDHASKQPQTPAPARSKAARF